MVALGGRPSEQPAGFSPILPVEIGSCPAGLTVLLVVPGGVCGVVRASRRRGCKLRGVGLTQEGSEAWG